MIRKRAAAPGIAEEIGDIVTTFSARPDNVLSRQCGALRANARTWRRHESPRDEPLRRTKERLTRTSRADQALVKRDAGYSDCVVRALFSESRHRRSYRHEFRSYIDHEFRA